VTAVIDLGKHNVLGVRVDAVDYEAAVNRIVQAAHARQPCAVSALAVHGVMTGVLDPPHQHRLNHLDLIVPDGQPVRWALNLLHRTGLRQRVYGPELMLRTCAAAAREGLPIFLFGGTPDLLAKLSDNLVARYPSLKIAGMRHSRFRRLDAQERAELVREIQQSGARITFVGLGCPRQEVWAYEFRNDLSMPILAVGAAFNFHAGVLAQAPEFLQRHGLEWAYRLFREPLRLWRRYLLLNPMYLALLFSQKLGLRTFDPYATPAPREPIMFG
jgi:exopolysaccharide biosynthesis WecB/TagA/CpsF family protein